MMCITLPRSLLRQATRHLLGQRAALLQWRITGILTKRSSEEYEGLLCYVKLRRLKFLALYGDCLG